MRDSFKLLAQFLALFWFGFLLQQLLPITHFGVIPRTTDGLWGIIFSPALHGNLSHLLANTTSLLLVGPLFLLVTANSHKVIAQIWIFSGALTWLIGRPNSLHIGASSLIFGMIGALMAYGWYRRDLKSVLVSVIAIFLYGGSLWGLLPSQLGVSWEGHLAGFAAGILVMRGQNRRPLSRRKKL